MLKQYLSRYFTSKSKPFKYITALVVILIVAGIGTYLLTSSHAAAPYSAITATNGSLGGNATSTSCSSSSTGSCIVFSGSNSGGGGGTGTSGSVIIGLNDLDGWGGTYPNPSDPGGPQISFAQYYQNNGFTWDRIYGCPTQAELNLGINILATLPDNGSDNESTSDSSSDISCMKDWNTSAYASRIIYEFANEPWEPSGSISLAGPYAQDYQALYNAKHADGILQPLLFMTIGELTDGGEMWLDAALQTVPNLQVDGFSAHPYGETGENDKNSYGVNALIYDQQEAASKGFTNTPWYVTEFGFTLNPSQQGAGGPSVATGWYVPSYAQQACQITLAYDQMLPYGDGTSGTWLKGIWYYQPHDDSTGDFGLMTDSNATGKDYAGETVGATSTTTISPRPAFTALAAFTKANYVTPPSGCSD